MKNTPKPPKELLELQEWFSDAVTSKDKQAEHFDAKKYLSDSDKLTATERLGIYMGDYWPRLIDSLADDFSILKFVWGDKVFRLIIEDYLAQFPSESFTLFHLGKALSSYIAEHYKKDNKELIQNIVDYEWAHMNAYMAANKTIFNPYKLSSDDQQNLSNTILSFHPSVSLLQLNYPLLGYVPGQDIPAQKTQFIIVYRKGSSVCEKNLNAIQYQLLQILSLKKPLSEVLIILSKQLSEDDNKILNESIQYWFQEMVEEEWLLHPLA